MLAFPAFNFTQQSIPHRSHLSLIENCKTITQLKQLHAATIKSSLFNNTSVANRILELCSNPTIGNLEYASSVFDRIESPDSVSWNLIIKCFVGNHRSDQAIILFYRMLHDSSIFPDNFTLPCVIKGCAQLMAIEEGEQIHGRVVKTGFQSDRFVQSCLVSMYVKCEKVGAAHQVFVKMPQRDLVSWNSLIDGYGKCGQIMHAHQLFDEMPEKDLFSWTALIDGYCKLGKIEIARELFDKMPDRNVVSWNAMIDGCMKCGEFECAERLFEKMPMRNVVTWNSMISGYEYNGRFKRALEVFQDMLMLGLKVTRATLVSALSAVSGLALLDKGRWIHSYMGRNGFEIGGVLGTSLIEMYSKCGCIESALQVFQTIPKRRLGHWTAIIVGLAMHGQANHALELFSEMQRIGIKPHAVTFVGVLNACSHAGLVEKGRQYFELMSYEYKISPSIQHYGCMVDLLCRAGHLEEAKELIEKMPMKPNEIVWMTVLSGCWHHKNIDIGEYAAKRVIELAPDSTACYVLLSNMYALAGQWSNVSLIRETMRERGVRKDPGCSLIEYDGIVHEFIMGDRSHYQTKEIYLKLDEMGQRLRCAGYAPDTTQVLLFIDEKEKEMELTQHSERLAISFGLINVEHGTPIRVVKNLRVCYDCHSVTKFLSNIYDREIIVRDNSRFHHFKNGACSCMDYW